MRTITTFSGKEVDPLNLRESDIDINDIAHALSMICRFNGHCSEFYSVAQHCVLVSKLCPAGYEFEALLHDATEAYLGDIPSPVKRQLPEFKEAENRAQISISALFGLPASESPEVKRADVQALEIEMRHLLNRAGGELSAGFDCFSPADAKAMFLGRFRELISSGNGA